MTGKYSVPLFMGCCIAVVAGLLVQSYMVNQFHCMIARIIYVSPLLIAIVLGIRRSRWAKWVALPGFPPWVIVAAVMWDTWIHREDSIGFSLGVPYFDLASTSEIVLITSVAVVALAGFVIAFVVKSGVPLWQALIVVAAATALEFGADKFVDWARIGYI